MDKCQVRARGGRSMGMLMGMWLGNTHREAIVGIKGRMLKGRAESLARWRWVLHLVHSGAWAMEKGLRVKGLRGGAGNGRARDAGSSLNVRSKMKRGGRCGGLGRPGPGKGQSRDDLSRHRRWRGEGTASACGGWHRQGGVTIGRKGTFKPPVGG